jgi:hypothetical protein
MTGDPDNEHTIVEVIRIYYQSFYWEFELLSQIYNRRANLKVIFL